MPLSAIARRRRYSRYADLYNQAYEERGRGQCVSRTLHGVIQQFLRRPWRMVHAPRHVDTLVRTQSLVTERVASELPDELLRWTLRLARFVENRAARVIFRWARHFLYRPAGPWVRSLLRDAAHFEHRWYATT